VEFGAFIIEVVLGMFDVLTVAADIHAWFKGRENRRERREARRAGMTAPSRDRWNRRVIVLSVVAVALTTFLVVRLFR
jgi:hypothetical protein